jgi:hypothetical protein
VDIDTSALLPFSLFALFPEGFWSNAEIKFEKGAAKTLK